jgi:DNA-directed RNA polymerase subunit D
MEQARIFQDPVWTRENTITFRLSPTHVAYANALRRLCMTEVESVAFRADIKSDGSTSDVQVLANSTPLTNETLAHRIGLIPIYADPGRWDPEKYEFILDKVNDKEETMDVFASDFVILEKAESGDRQVPSHFFFPPHTKTHQTALIAVLKPLMPGGKPEELRVRAKASVGTGRQNARFIPTTQCAYAYTRDTNEEHVREAFHNWLLRFKKGDPTTVEADSAKKEPLWREFQTLEVNRCYLKDEKGEPYSFDFTVESVGPINPVTIVLKACEKGAELCRKYAEENLGDDVTVQPADSQIVGFDFIFQKQDHTLGHLIQAWIDANLIDGGEVTFAGYDIPHPLRDEMVIRIGVADGNEATARRAIRAAMTACMGMFEVWANQWDRLIKGSQNQNNYGAVNAAASSNSNTNTNSSSSSSSPEEAPPVLLPRRVIKRPTAKPVV